MIAFGCISPATSRPRSAVGAVRTSYPSRRSIRANVSVTLSSSSTTRILDVVAGLKATAVTRSIVSDDPQSGSADRRNRFGRTTINEFESIRCIETRQIACDALESDLDFPTTLEAFG